jgi:hypothetical protein
MPRERSLKNYRSTSEFGLNSCARQAILLVIFPFFRRKIRHVPEASRTDFARVRDAVRRALALPQSEVAALGRRAIQFDNKLSKLECSCASF